MSAEKEIRWGTRARYENLEIFREDAGRLRSEAVCGMIVNLTTRLTGVFGNLMAPLGKTMRPALTTTGNARHQGSAV